jgi:hypothetical protein
MHHRSLTMKGKVVVVESQVLQLPNPTKIRKKKTVSPMSMDAYSYNFHI